MSASLWSFFDIIPSRYLDSFGIMGKTIFYRTPTKSILIPTSMVSSAILAQSILASSMTQSKIQKFDDSQQIVFTLVHEYNDREANV